MVKREIFLSFTDLNVAIAVRSLASTFINNTFVILVFSFHEAESWFIDGGLVDKIALILIPMCISVPLQYFFDYEKTCVQNGRLAKLKKAKKRKNMPT